MHALYTTFTVAVALFAVGCNEIVGFGDLPAVRRTDLSQCYLTSFASPPSRGVSVDVDLRFVDGSGGPLQGELSVSTCAFQPPDRPLDCSTPETQAQTQAGALVLSWPVPGPRPGPPGGERPPGGEPPPPGPPGGPGGEPPYVLVESETYFPTLVLRRPSPIEGGFFPAVPVFMREALRTTLEPAEFAPFLAERAHLVVVVHDCENRPAAEVEVELESELPDVHTLPFARDEGGRPAYNQKTSGRDGLVGYLNIPTSGGRADARLQLRDRQSGAPIAFRGSDRPVLLQQGQLTLVLLAL